MQVLGSGHARPRSAAARPAPARGRRPCAGPAAGAPRRCAPPPPTARSTGSGCRKSRTRSAGTTTRPSGLARVEASLATNLVGATPTEQVSRSSCADPATDQHRDLGGRPSSRRAPATSRNASSMESGSTSGVIVPEDSHDGTGRGRVLGEVGRQEHRAWAQPAGPRRSAWRCVRRRHAPRSWRSSPRHAGRSRRRSPDVPRSSGRRRTSTSAKNASMSTCRIGQPLSSAPGPNPSAPPRGSC